MQKYVSCKICYVVYQLIVFIFSLQFYFIFSIQIIAWSDFLLLLEGDEVHLPAPKTHFARDMCVPSTADCPIFCTTSHQLIFMKGGVIDERETEMMAVRWRTFILTRQIPQRDQRSVPACPRCFAEFVLSSR